MLSCPGVSQSAAQLKITNSERLLLRVFWNTGFVSTEECCQVSVCLVPAVRQNSDCSHSYCLRMQTAENCSTVDKAFNMTSQQLYAWKWHFSLILAPSQLILFSVLPQHNNTMYKQYFVYLGSYSPLLCSWLNPLPVEVPLQLIHKYEGIATNPSTDWE